MIGPRRTTTGRQRVIGERMDVWTDAAAQQGGRQYRIAQNVSSSAAFALVRILTGEGWHARAVKHGASLTTDAETPDESSEPTLLQDPDDERAT